MPDADRGHGKAMGYLCRLYFEGLRRAGKDGQGPDDVVQGLVSICTFVLVKQVI
jgi:hypothetical protein